MHLLVRVWTDTLVEASDEVTVFDEQTVFDEAPLFDDDSVMTSPFSPALPVEPPTTIFDVPRPSRKKLLARLHELEQTYDAAMRVFL